MLFLFVPIQGRTQDFEKEGALVILVTKQLGDSRGAVSPPSGAREKPRKLLLFGPLPVQE